METEKDIGSEVKRRLESFTDSPDDLVWNKIEGELRKKKKRRGLIFWTSVLGFIILSTLLLIGIQMYDSNENEPQHLEESVVKNNTAIDSFATNQSIKMKNTETIDSDSLTRMTEKKSKNNSSLKRQKQQLPKEKIKYDSSQYLNSDRENLITTRDKLNDTTKEQESGNPKNESFSKIKKTEQARTIQKNTTVLTTDSIHQITKKLNSKNKLITSIFEGTNLVNSSFIITDTLKLEQQLNPLASEKLSDEKTKDSSNTNTSKWSITPQLNFVNYGAFNVKTTNNLSTNFGAILSYRTSNTTYLRFGIRKLDLSQTVDSIRRNVKYLEIPLSIKYIPFDKKINPYFTGGISYFIPTDSSTEGNTLMTSSNHLDYNNCFGLNVGLGVESKLFKNLSLNVESSFNYQIKPIEPSNTIKPFLLMFNIGLEYRF